jgi:hypothetical protein
MLLHIKYDSCHERILISNEVMQGFQQFEQDQKWFCFESDSYMNE